MQEVAWAIALLHGGLSYHHRCMLGGTYTAVSSTLPRCAAFWPSGGRQQVRPRVLAAQGGQAAGGGLAVGRLCCLWSWCIEASVQVFGLPSKAA